MNREDEVREAILYTQGPAGQINLAEEYRRANDPKPWPDLMLTEATEYGLPRCTGFAYSGEQLKKLREWEARQKS